MLFRSDAKARFLQRSSEVDLDLVVLGNGTLFVGERHDLDGLMFRSLPLNTTVYAENSDGAVDILYTAEALTRRKAVQRWGVEALQGTEAMKDTKTSDADEIEGTFTFIWKVAPRKERNPKFIDPLNKPYASIWVEKESGKIVSESGFDFFPFAVPRWDTMSGEIYGRSPGMIALGDAQTSQQQAKTLLRAGHKAVDPPLLAPDDSIVGQVRQFAGGMTYYDASAMQSFGGRSPVIPLVSGANVPVGREMQNDTRELIWQAFFRDVLRLPAMRDRTTATEITARKEEFLQLIGPVFNRLEADYPATVVNIVFAIMMRANAFLPIPQELSNKDIRFEYESPVEKVRKQIEASSAIQTADMIGPFVEADPSIMDNFDGDVISRAVALANGMPNSWLRTEDKVKEIRALRAKEAEEQAAVEQGAVMAKAGADLSKIPGQLEGTQVGAALADLDPQTATAQ